MDHPFKKLVVYQLPDSAHDVAPELLTAQNIVCINEAGSSDEAQALLSKILQSVNVSAFSQLVVPFGNSIRLSQMISIDQQNLISFGPTLDQLGLSATVAPYKIGKLGDFTILLAEDLATIGSSNAKKKMLWEALKEMFDAGTN